MLMYRKVNKYTDREIDEMIIAGFTGQLKGWWDNYLTHDQRFQIMNATKIEEEKTVQNSVYSLVMNIIKHFSGRCVMELPESNNTHWKSKFIEGLPPYLLKGVCTQEGLALCNEIKLNQQIKKHHLNERQQLGVFCEQFAIDIPFNRKKSHKENDFKRKKSSTEKHYERTQRRKVFHKARKGFIKSKNPQAYYKCRRIGHYAKDCKIKDKIKDLDLDDSIKDSYIKISGGYYSFYTT
ncbi:uncharacterized protein [Nicotiana sylvestris]|uniref:uncharacterized protein n=1 Tax=Nicotiana sylvestris TaxID=4096 RepID=UPI00388C5FAF